MSTAPTWLINTNVRRAEKTEGSRFTRILNSVLQDQRLSYRARGLLATVLSLPPTWAHSAKRLAQHSPDGQDAVLSALRELAAAGYAEKQTFRSSGGRMASRWLFWEFPPDAKKPGPVTLLPDATLPGGGQPGSGLPGSGLCPLYETTNAETKNVETIQLASPLGGRGGMSSALMESLATATEGPLDKLTAPAAKDVRMSLSEIMKVNPNLTSEEIVRRADNYRSNLPQMLLTARALAKHWARCDRPMAGSTQTHGQLSTDIGMDELKKRFGGTF